MSSADLTVYKHPMSSILTPMNQPARDWVRENLSPEIVWWSGGAVVENSYLEVILTGARAAGLSVEVEGE